MAAAEPPSRQPGPSAPLIVVLLSVAALLFESAADVLPDTPFLVVLTWQRLITAAGLVAAVVAGARWRHFRTRLDIPIVVLLLSSLVAAYRWGGDASFRHLLSYVAVYYLATALMRIERTAWRTIVVLAAAAVIVAGAIAIGQSSENVPTGFCRSSTLQDASCSDPGVLVRATGTFTNPNLLAAFLLLLVPLAVLAVTMFHDKLQRIVVISAIVFACAALLVTYSRGPYIAGFAAALVLAWQWARTRLNREQMRIAGGTGIGVLLLALVGIAVMSQAGRSFGVRNEAWSAALGVAADQPLGVGLGRAGDVVNARIEGSVEFFHLHNLWLNWLVEAGVPGFLGITAVTVGAVVTAAGLARSGHPIGFVVLASLIGFLTMNLMDHPTNLGRLAVVFWLVLGVVMGAAPARWRVPMGGYEMPEDGVRPVTGEAWPVTAAVPPAARSVPRHRRGSSSPRARVRAAR